MRCIGVDLAWGWRRPSGVAVLDPDGRVVDEGTKTDVFTPPHHPYTELLLSSVPEMDPDWLDRVLEARVAARA